MTDRDSSKGLASVRRMVADDALAISFQSMAQYRTAILKHIDAAMQSTCAHRWKTTQYGQTYADLECQVCGKTERQSWD